MMDRNMDRQMTTTMTTGQRVGRGMAAAMLLMGTKAVRAELIGPVNGDGMVYDTVLDLCWMQEVVASGARNWHASGPWLARLR